MSSCMWVAGCGEGAHSEVPQLPCSQGVIEEHRWRRGLPLSMGGEAGKYELVLCP